MEDRRNFIPGNTFVFWDIVDFPVEEGKIDSFRKNVKSSLLWEGYRGNVRITAYGDRPDPSIPLEFESVHPRIRLLRRTSRYARHTSIFVAMLAATRWGPEANFLLIIKGGTEEGSELGRLVKEMRRMGYNVLFVADNVDDICAYQSILWEVQSSSTVWIWKNLLQGVRPMGLTTSQEDDDYSEDDSDDEGSSQKRPKMASSSVCGV